MRLVTIFCSLVSFAVVWFMTPWFIRYLRKIDLVVKDMNKKDKPLIPLSGGLTVMCGIVTGLMFYIFFQTFFQQSSFNTNHESFVFIFAALTSIMTITFVGFIDDLIIKKSKSSSIGLNQWQKPLLTVIAAIPLMVVNAGYTSMAFPVLGGINFGVLYPLLLIPIGVVGAANMVNLLAGFNGSEAGMGIIYMGMLGLYAYVNKSYIGSLLALITFAALLAFYYFNKYPAKIFPGDSLTYLLGAVLACIAILGNLEKATLICSIPFFIEFVLKARGRFKMQSYGYYKDGKVQSMYKKIYSIPHILTRTGKFTEKQVTYFMMLVELVFASLIWFI